MPQEVWNFHIGGYQVCEKWLKNRQAKGGKNPRPGRVLTNEDIAHYQKIIVALRMVQEWLTATGLATSPNFQVQVGAASERRVRKFDLGCAEPATLIECKRHTWTKGGNAPSAKLYGPRHDATPSCYSGVFHLMATPVVHKTALLPDRMMPESVTRMA